MRTEDFNFHLPEDRIAQSPLKERDQSKLLVLNKKTGEIQHNRFLSIIDYLNEGDTLVLNDTKVLPARLFGYKEDTGGKVEILLIKEADSQPLEWLVMAKPAKKLKMGTRIIFKEGLLSAKVKDVKEEGLRVLTFSLHGEKNFTDTLDLLGEMPLPPYISETLEEPDRYQTVYSKNIGSVAAPTAGLHFTEKVFKGLRDKGVNIAYITLHVGLGTFKPVEAENLKDHKMHEEFYTVSKEVAETLEKTRKKGKRIIGVGTTSCRTLESIMKEHNEFREASGWTDIFIYPGYQFRGIDGLITNFHLPKSTLIMLVSAFAGIEPVMKAYDEAIKKNYRFYSFGDAMMLL